MSGESEHGESRPRQVSVGINGSAADSAPSRWAIADAAAREAELHFVCAVSSPQPGGGRGPAQRKATEVVSQAMAYARAVEPSIVVSGRAIPGDAAHVLIESSAESAAIVLGSRLSSEPRASRSGLLGSVSSEVAANAHCPVIVVPGDAAPVSQLPVVVGLDSTSSAETVLAYAFDYASFHRVPITAILCWRADRFASMLWQPEQAPLMSAQFWLSEALAGWTERYPDVPVDAVVDPDDPVGALIRGSGSASLVVVGSRGGTTRWGGLVGSVSQSVLQHSACAVAVVPTRDGG